MPPASPFAHTGDSPHPSLTPSTEPTPSFSPGFPTTPRASSAHEDYIEELLDADPVAAEFIDTSSLTSTDVKHDPILASLAQQQHGGAGGKGGVGGDNKGGAGFKAKPAPSTTRTVGLGPRMTKAAALRLGLKWDGIKPKREEKEKVDDGKGTPGYKRVGLGINVASLAPPTFSPRPTKASQLRTGGQVSTPQSTKKDPLAIAAANKARADEEKEKRRKSVVLPASLMTPSITPRQNKSSMLRTGIKSSESVSSGSSLTQTMGALKVTSNPNARPNLAKDDSAIKAAAAAEREEKLKRRSSLTGVRSLGTPSIAPRLNRAALLRAPHTSHASISHPPSSFTPPTPISKPVRPAAQSTPKTTSTPSVPTHRSSSSLSGAGAGGLRSAPSPGPRPTKASLLRAAKGGVPPKAVV
ncbi:hypothetical protein IAT38_005311 [Cryptococcus sp. DSM 104549]